MQIAFNLWGKKIKEFSQLINVPKSLFYDSESEPDKSKDELGVIINDKLPSWKNLVGIRYKNNDTKLIDKLYTTYYGDVRKIRHDGRIPICCDLIDESFWYYCTALKHTGLFTFSVNTNVADPLVYISTIKSLIKLGEFIRFGDLAW